MKILNIHVYFDTKEQTIKLRFDAIGNNEVTPTFDPELVDRLGGEDGFFGFMGEMLSERNVNLMLESKPDTLDEMGKGGVDLSVEEEIRVIRDPMGADYFRPIDLKVKMIAVLNNYIELSPAFGETIKDIYNNSCRAFEAQAFNPHELPPIYFNLHENNLERCDQNSAAYQQQSVVYQLPTTPHIALSLLFTLSNVILNQLKYEAIYFNPGYHDSLSLSVYQNDRTTVGKDHGTEFMVTMLTRLFELPKLANYQYTMAALNKIGEPYIKYRQTPNRKGWIDLLEGESCCKLLWDAFATTLLNSEQSLTVKNQLLLDTARQYIHEGQKAELDYMLKRVNLLAKKKLYASCLGKPSFHEKPYALNSSEIEFFKEAQFVMGSDGCMRIINLDKNKTYKKIYAEGKNKHDSFTDEIKFFCTLLGLESASSDFHKEIIFTKESSLNLQSRGIHLNHIYVKNLLHTHNHFFFSGTKENNIFNQLPFELKNSIQEYETSCVFL